MIKALFILFSIVLCCSCAVKNGEMNPNVVEFGYQTLYVDNSFKYCGNPKNYSSTTCVNCDRIGGNVSIDPVNSVLYSRKNKFNELLIIGKKKNPSGVHFIAPKCNDSIFLSGNEYCIVYVIITPEDEKIVSDYAELLQQNRVDIGDIVGSYGVIAYRKISDTMFGRIIFITNAPVQNQNDLKDMLLNGVITAN